MNTRCSNGTRFGVPLMLYGRLATWRLGSVAGRCAATAPLLNRSRRAVQNPCSSFPISPPRLRASLSSPTSADCWRSQAPPRTMTATG
jgi:hypothetical protein